MPERDEWEELSKNIIKAELARKGIDYSRLSILLDRIGIHVEPSNLNSKINRGKFGFPFFLQCMQAIGTDTVNIKNGEQNGH
ncbi:MAG: hypothetical protein IE909_06780 [Campylobacterales bacterium]|nr:hypothetical protein [Campylobacterales bacterium]MBD3823315.1 hypothetical protein [Campylobacterota bacterium]MBD3841579.1 hypothetical protein [Campylobacterales bacterium]